MGYEMMEYDAPSPGNLTASAGLGLCVVKIPPSAPGMLPTRCRNYAEQGKLVCGEHISDEPSREMVVQNAQNLFLSLTEKAVNTIAALTDDPDPKVRLQASQEILNRAGVSKAGEAVNVNINVEASATESLASRLKGLVDNAAQSNEIISKYFGAEFHADTDEYIEAEEILDDETDVGYTGS